MTRTNLNHCPKCGGHPIIKSRSQSIYEENVVIECLKCGLTLDCTKYCNDDPFGAAGARIKWVFYDNHITSAEDIWNTQGREVYKYDIRGEDDADDWSED